MLTTESLFGAVIPSIEMAAAGLDSIAAIVGYAVCSGISITSGSLVYSILSGPLQVHTKAFAFVIWVLPVFACMLSTAMLLVLVGSVQSMIEREALRNDSRIRLKPALQC